MDISKKSDKFRSKCISIQVGDFVKFYGFPNKWEEVKSISHFDHGIKSDAENYCCINGQYCNYDYIKNIRKSEKLK